MVEIDRRAIHEQRESKNPAPSTKQQPTTLTFFLFPFSFSRRLTGVFFPLADLTAPAHDAVR
jgi:hypothetical protein